MSTTLFISTLMLSLSSSSAVNPIAKVVSMITGLENSVIKEGQEAQSLYNEFAGMCEERSRELHNEIKTGKAKGAELTATIEKAVADVSVLEEKISDTADGTSDAEAELKKATELRAKETADFKTEQAELLKTIGTIERAVTLIERQGAGASLAQLQRAGSITQVLQVMAEAEAINSDDAGKLTALVQQSSDESSSDSEEEDDASAAASESKGGQIAETLEALLEKTQKQLEDARSSERNSLNSYEMLKQSLEDKVKTMTREMGDAKKTKAAAGETQATAQGNLEITNKDHSEDEKELAELHRECLDKATAFEESMTSHNEELKALAEAKKILVGTTGGAKEQTYDLAQTSFVQVKAKSTGSTALHMVRRIALKDHSDALLELANHIERAIQKSSLTGADPFNKVKRMIGSMVNKLLKEAESEAKKKDYCDKELAETKTSREDKESTIEKISTQIDVMSAESKKLKSEVARLGKELGSLTRNQAEMDKVRVEEKALYSENKPVMEKGQEGVKTALKVLRDYYAQGDKGSSDGGSASGIIGMLEVVESDFSKGIAEMTSSEESSQSEYDEATQENKVSQATKEQDVKFKTAEYVSLDKNIAELASDRSGSKTELSAVLEYSASLKKDCVAAPSSYEDRKQRREDEIAGLKDALDSLGSEAVLLQRTSVHRTLRGGRLEASA